jgi:hypothetical protein
VKNVYFEYLSERYRNDEGPRRMAQFESGHPAAGDLTAIRAAREAYEQNLGSGRAVDASRDALYGQFDREEIKKKEVDPIRYSKDLEYHQRMEVLIAAQVEQRRVERAETRPQDRGPDRVAEQEMARENYERQMQKDTGNRDAERTAAREAYEKSLNRETRDQTVQQESVQLTQRSDRNNPNRYDPLRKPDGLGR